MSDELDGLLIL